MNQTIIFFKAKNIITIEQQLKLHYMCITCAYKDYDVKTKMVQEQ